MYTHRDGSGLNALWRRVAQLATSYFGFKPKDDVVGEKLKLQREMIRESSAVMVQKTFRSYRARYTRSRRLRCV
jgi:hypothetical protein